MKEVTIEAECLNTACSYFVSKNKCKMFKLIEWCGYKQYKTKEK